MTNTYLGQKSLAAAFTACSLLLGLPAAGCLSPKQTEACCVDTRTIKYLYRENRWEEYVLRRDKVITCNDDIVFKTKDEASILFYDLIREHDELLVGALLRSHGRLYLVLYNATRARFILVKEMTAHRPWKLQLFDADGDGRIEVCLGVYKKSPLHPVEARRLFLYTFAQGALRPKWLGSRLAHPFTDFAFAAGAEGPSLFAIELDKNRRGHLCRYHWEAFGFTKLKEYPETLPPEAALVHGHHPGDRQPRLLLKRGNVILKEVK